MMVHPNEYSVPEREVTDCSQFGELSMEGWGGMTSADMADEAYFERYCGLQSIAKIAHAARTSAFDPAGLTESEIGEVPAQDWPTLAPKEPERQAPNIHQAKDDARTWIAETTTLTMRVHDVALADFDDDGVGERLLFIAARARGGTAGFATYALLDHDEDDAIRLRMIRFK